MSDDIHVTGLADLQKFLDQLAPKVEANIMRGALRAGMKVIQPIAQQNVHPVSGLLAAGLKIRTSRRGGKVVARLVATGRHAFIAKFVEFGTAAHVIAGKAGGWLSFGGTFARAIDHPGARAKPFMRPALDGQAQNAVVATGEYVKNRLTTKEGLDASAIRVEGDE